ncbi:DUF185-domain-containing protein [Ascoidea rubescens DSM 1968]|uniref:Protein arginine methyltransferase NDUFAF7 n=1 Tax=Ascoidea rubescens DSM 1968 TaxID=1344418 RepID=A0A1D2V8L5_9ASCO|nr:DUF185-domain-containing protein [Ascoidea rubescens DSM 1968]ODV58041.1 DUF185-domain-containing protein [Ascoidea rubescens DSM 1968]
MKTCLTHPEYGYYTTRDPLGLNGKSDFITSPEISQMFGEMLGIWFFSIWLDQLKPLDINFVEFGPGKGTLIYDLIKTFNKLSQTTNLKLNINIILVEASPILRKEQWKLLSNSIHRLIPSDDKIGFTSKSTWNNNIRWIDNETDLDAVLSNNSTNYIIAHEFFDALPIKQFEKTSNGWHELLVDYSTDEKIRKLNLQNDASSLPNKTTYKSSDLDKNKNSSLIQDYPFFLTLSPKKTVSSNIPESNPRFNSFPIGSRVEVSIESIDHVKKISQFINYKGAALIIDYGPLDTCPINTLRGIKSHKLLSPFYKPGEVDLSADVDFQNLKQVVADQVKSFGPVEQADFLHQLGLGYRADQLIHHSKSLQEKERIKKSYLRLTENTAGSMGKLYKFLGLLPKNTIKLPVGFGGDVSSN